MMTRRVLMILAAVLGLTAALAAQATAGQERMQKMKERVELSPEQTEQVRAVLAEEAQQLKAIQEKHGGDRNRLRMAREMRGVRDATDQKLKTILSKKQMEGMKKIREEGRGGVRGKGSRGG